MAIRRPLVLNNGLASDLPAGDQIKTSSDTSTVIAGSGLIGGGDASTDIYLRVGLAPSPSGVIYVGDSLGLDGTDIVRANTALASGVAAQVLSATVVSSGDAAIATAQRALASGNAALAAIAPFQGGDTYRAVYTASSNVSVGDAVGVDDANRVRPIFGAPNPSQRLYNANVASGYYNSAGLTIQESTGSFMQIIDVDGSLNYYATPALINNSKSITLYSPLAIGTAGGSYERAFSRAGSTTDTTTFVTFLGDVTNSTLFVSRRVGTSNSSPTSVSVRTGWTFSMAAAPWPNNGVILAYNGQNSDGSNRVGFIRLASISSGSATLGTALNILSGSTYTPYGLGYDPTSLHVILISQFGSANGSVHVYSHSGTSLSNFNTYTPFTSLPIIGGPDDERIVFDTNVNRNIFFYRANISGVSRLCYIVFNFTGGTYSFGTPTVLSSSSTSTISSTYDSVNRKVIVKYFEGSDNKVSIGSVSGTTFTIESTSILNSPLFGGNIEYNVGTDLVIGRNNVYISTGEIARNITPTFNTKNNFIGIAQSAAASGATTTVALPGSINYSKTGLTPGAFYYPDILTSGAITTESGQPSSWSSDTPWRAPLRAVTSSGLLVLDSL